MSHLSCYKLLNTIGRGSYGRVKVAIHTPTDKQVAVKIIELKNITDQDFKNFEREIAILQKLDHPHIAKIHEVIRTPNRYYLVMELIPNGDLQTHLEKAGKVEESKALYWFQQLIYAVDYFHKKHISHRDLKLENLLLDSNNNVKVGDFGFATPMRDGCFLYTFCGSPHYASPEILSSFPYCGTEIDIWSCGVILFSLVAGYLPFDENNYSIMFAKIKNAKFKMPPNFSRPLKDLIYRMLDPDPVARITAQQIKNHPWVNINIPPYLLYSPNKKTLRKLNSESLLRVSNPLRERSLSEFSIAPRSDDLSSEDFSNQGDNELYLPPWKYGFSCKMSGEDLAAHLSKILVDLKLKWKSESKFCYKVCYEDSLNSATDDLAFYLKIFKDEDVFILTFQDVAYRNPLILFDLFSKIYVSFDKLNKQLN
ncbi:SNF1-like_8 [Blepharisma stoltei]|uniref:Protein kinase domain-containing protein n=1 Tax=Blepharisma stoltei TaxID=1481888 RepID=A0AAU9JI35_9CILI|nr:unnamed protein product [Blepharisma stoltei]